MSIIKNVIGFLVGTIVLWIGGTAYISSNTKSYLDTYVKRTNILYQANGMGMSITTFEKGFFSSDAAIKIDFTNPDMRAVVSETIKLPINVNYTIENGPLFVENGLGFGLSRIQNDINISKYYVDTGVIKEYLKNDIVFTSNTIIDFTNNARFEGSTNELVINLEGKDLTISPLKVAGKMDIKTFKGKINFNVDSIFFEHKDDLLKINDISIDANIKEIFDNGFYMGNFIFDIGNINTKSADLPFSLENAKLKMSVDIHKNDNETVDIDFKVEGDTAESKLPEAYAFVKKAEVTYALRGMKLEGILAFQDFTKSLQAKQQDIVSRLQSPKTGELDMEVFTELENMQKETASGMMLLMAGLLEQNSTSIGFETKMLDKKNKKSGISMNIGYVGDMIFPKDAKVLESKFKKELLNLITLDFNVDLEKSYIDNLPEQLKQELVGQLQMGAMFGIVKENNNSFSLDVNYKPKTLMLNAQDRSEMLPMIEMGLGGDELELF